MITADQARELFDYDPKTGWLHWRSSRGRVKAGDRAGSFYERQGRINIQISKERYLAHRLIWLMEYGAWPDEIDHINHIPTDNRLENLRNVTHQENHCNRSMCSRNKSGTVGVRFVRKRWQAVISHGGREIYLGKYKDEDKAIAKRKMAEVIYGFHPNHGR
jgi:hypothetical protein